MRCLAVILLPLCLVLGPYCSAQSPRVVPRAAPESGNVLQAQSTDELEALVVDSVLVGPVKSDRVGLEIRLRNRSSRVITAYGYSLLIEYPGNVHKAQSWTVDILGEWAASQMPGTTMPGSGGFLTPGGIRTEVQWLRSGPGQALPVRASGTVTMLVYEDRTAFGDATQLKLVFSGRSMRAQDMAAALVDINDALADPGVGGLTATQSAGKARLRQLLGARVNGLKRAQSRRDANLRRAAELETFYDQLARGDAEIFQHMLASYEIMQRALEQGSNQAEAK